MERVKRELKRLWTDESAQGMTEYVLLLVIVVALILVFKDRIQSMVKSKIEDLSSGMSGINTGP